MLDDDDAVDDDNDDDDVMMMMMKMMLMMRLMMATPRKLSFLWSAGAEMSHEGWVQNAHKDRLIYQVGDADDVDDDADDDSDDDDDDDDDGSLCSSPPANKRLGEFWFRRFALPSFCHACSS